MRHLLARSDLRDIGIPRATIISDFGRFLYYDGSLSIVTAKLHKGQRLPLHFHDHYELLAIYRGKVDHLLQGPRTVPSSSQPEPEKRTLGPLDIVVVPPSTHGHSWAALSPDTWVVVAGGTSAPNWLDASDSLARRTRQVARLEGANRSRHLHGVSRIE
jgi:hypothetical protein